jgi:hypothetical protein
MLGQLQDAGNTTTLAQYLHLLETAFLISGLDSYRSGPGRKRAASPKLVFWNNALVTAYLGSGFKQTRQDLPWWGRLVENAAGAHLLNGLDRPGRGLAAFLRDNPKAHPFIVGHAGMPLEEFFLTDPAAIFD